MPSNSPRASKATISNSGGISGLQNGILVAAGAILVTAGFANVQNSGTIVSTADQGVELFGGGTVTNAAGGSISGLGDAGIFVIGGVNPRSVRRGTCANQSTAIGPRL
jgi:hypothetical protein